MLIRLRRKVRAALVRHAPMWLRYLYPTPKLDVRAVVSNVDRRRDGRPMRVNVFRLFVRCELASEVARPIRGAETTEARFFGEDELPDVSPGRCTPAEMERIFEHQREPDRPADFD